MEGRSRAKDLKAKEEPKDWFFLKDFLGESKLGDFSDRPATRGPFCPFDPGTTASARSQPSGDLGVDFLFLCNGKAYLSCWRNASFSGEKKAISIKRDNKAVDDFPVSYTKAERPRK